MFQKAKNEAIRHDLMGKRLSFASSGGNDFTPWTIIFSPFDV